MAVLEPLRALRYDERVAGPLDRLIAPPYDVVDAAEHAALLVGSPHNVVALDQPRAPDGGDPHAHAAALLRAWRAAGVVVREREPALWLLEQTFTDPRSGARRTRRGVLGRVRVEEYGEGRIRPHERTHPPAIADRLALARATGAHLSPLFALYAGDAAGPLGAGLAGTAPWAQATDLEGTTQRLWPVTDPARIAAAQAILAGAELLIADGHHRYEAARQLAAAGGDPYVPMLLVSTDDPGLEILPTHRLLTGPVDLDALTTALGEAFLARPVVPDALEPPPDRALSLGYLDAAGTALRLTREAPADAAFPPGTPAVLRGLDTAILEALVLRGAAGLSAEDVQRQRGLAYARTTREAIGSVQRGEAQAAFLLRPTTIAQVLAVAAEGLTMPPKSTSFFPKVPAGLLFSPAD